MQLESRYKIYFGGGSMFLENVCS